MGFIRWAWGGLAIFKTKTMKAPEKIYKREGKHEFTDDLVWAVLAWDNNGTEYIRKDIADKEKEELKEALRDVLDQLQNEHVSAIMEEAAGVAEELLSK